MTDDGSVSIWIDGLKAGEAQAASELWERYKNEILHHARRRLAHGTRRVADEEDIALSAFDSLCRGAERGKFAKLDDRNDLWQLLLMITARKAGRQVEHERRRKRGSGKVRGESSLDLADEGMPRGLEQFAGQSLSPDFVAAMEDELQRLMRITGDETLRKIALLRMEGYTNQEIADATGRALRSVERKLKLIRDIWSNS